MFLVICPWSGTSIQWTTDGGHRQQVRLSVSGIITGVNTWTGGKGVGTQEGSQGPTKDKGTWAGTEPLLHLRSRQSITPFVNAA